MVKSRFTISSCTTKSIGGHGTLTQRIFIAEAQIIYAWHRSSSVKILSHDESGSSSFFPHRRGNLSAAVVVITTVTATVSAHKQKMLDAIHGLILLTVKWNSFRGKHWFPDNNGGLHPCRGGKSGDAVGLSRRAEEILRKWSQENVRLMTWTDSDTCESPYSTLKHQNRA